MTFEYTHAIILDFEATCDDRKQSQPREIIEFPSVLVSLDSLETVDEFRAFVRPHHHPVLTEFCKELTSIRQAEVDAAEPFPEVFTNHQAWLEGHRLTEHNAVVVTCGDWDLGTMLPAQCKAAVPAVEGLPAIYTCWHNLKRSFCSIQDSRKAPGMAGMLRELGLPLVGCHHRGIDDCRNLAELGKLLLRKGAHMGVTGELSIAQYPPITISLRFGDRIEEMTLRNRSVKTLHGLAGSIFRCRLSDFRRGDGSSVSQDEDLLWLRPGEELLVS